MGRIQFLFCGLALLFTTPLSIASGTLSESQVSTVTKAEVEAEKLSIVAGYLADYEIEAKKLINNLPSTTLAGLNQQATTLLNLSRSVIESARFRLPQCDAYLNQTMNLIPRINTISLAQLERDYHHDGALPPAPPECYHTKDLFVHPATVLVLSRLNPGLSTETKSSIEGEIAEVLTHLNLVRELVVY